MTDQKPYAITDLGAFEAWVRFNFPEGLTVVVAPWVVEEIQNNGHLTRRDEKLIPAGVETVSYT